MRQVRVHMMSGEHIVDMMNTFVPYLYTYQPKSTHRAIAVRMHEGSLLTSASLDSPHPCVNRDVAGRPIAGALSPEAASSMGPAHGNCEDAALAASRQGWFLEETDCTGDCGVDAMACNEPGVVRGAKVWKSIRMELSDFVLLRGPDRLRASTPRCPQARHKTSNDVQSLPPCHSQDIWERRATRICRHSGRPIHARRRTLRHSRRRTLYCKKLQARRALHLCLTLSNVALLPCSRCPTSSFP